MIRKIYLFSVEIFTSCHRYRGEPVRCQSGQQKQIRESVSYTIRPLTEVTTEMDPASIIGLTATAIGLASRTVNELTSLFRAREEIKATAKEVNNIKATLESLQQQYNPGSSSYTSLQLQQLHTVISDTNDTLTEINKIIAKSTTTILGRARWSAGTSEISSHRVRLIGCTSMINVLISSLSEYVIPKHAVLVTDEVSM